jgi:Dolichyl-phosphate-mannose-protein mannosyltransferase
MSPRRSSTAKAARLAVVALLVLGLAVILALSFVPYERLRDHLDTFTVDRDADVSRREFDEIVLRLRLLSIGLAGLAGLLVLLGGTIDRVATEIARCWASAVRGAPAAAWRWLTRESPSYLAALGLVFAIAVALRVIFLDVPLRYDEATTYNNFVSKPLYVGLAHYPLPNNHLLHTFLAKVSVVTFGADTWAIRLPALLAGLALVPTTFALARILYGRAAALLAAALVASSSTLVEYSTNARGYTLVALLTVGALVAAIRVLESDSIGAWAVIVVAGALGLHAVPVMLYPLGGILLWVVASGLAAGRPLRPLLARTGAAAFVTGILTLVLYAPVYAASGIRSVTSNDFVEPTSWGSFFERLPEHFQATYETWVRDQHLVVEIAFVVGLVGALALTPLVSRYRIPPLLAMVAWIAPVLVVQRVVPFTRVWLFLVPVALAAVAGFYGWLAERARARRALVPALAALVALGGAWAVVDGDSVRASRETGALLDAPAVAVYLAETVEPGDRVFATGSDSILEYYLRREGIDPTPLLYTSDRRVRTYLVVNVLGGQILDHYEAELDPSLGPPRLLRTYPSASVYVVAPRT